MPSTTLATTASTATTPPPALTTLFTPSSSCLVDIWQYSATNTDLQCYVGNTQVQCNYVQLGPSTTSSSCFPSGWRNDRSAYFSPGICPVGYANACSSLVTDGGSTETRVTCCPSGYSCQTDSTAWPWYATDQCTYTNPGPVTYVYTSSVPGAGVVTSTVSKNEGFNAYGVQVRFQASDSISAFTATQTTTTSDIVSSSSGGGGGAGPTSSTSTSASATPNPQTTGLSTGAKAGIGVGVAVAGLIVIAAVAFFFRRRRRTVNQQGGGLADRSELSAQDPGIAPKHELHSTQYSELQSTQYSELQNNSISRPVEME